MIIRGEPRNSRLDAVDVPSVPRISQLIETSDWTHCGGVVIVCDGMVGPMETQESRFFLFVM